MAAHSFSSPPGLTVTGACRKRTGTLAGNTGLQRRAGVAGNAGPQVSNRIPVPGEVGVAHRDQVPEPAGHQPAGVPVNARARTAVTYPGFTRPGEKFYCPFQC